MDGGGIDSEKKTHIHWKKCLCLKYLTYVVDLRHGCTMVSSYDERREKLY